MPRTFVAILLGEQARKNVAAQITRLRPLSKAVTWVAPTSLHVTLSFLGDQTVEQLRDIMPALEQAAEGVSGFTMGLRGVGAFPGLEHPRTIWVGVADGGEVRYLQSRVAEALERLGISGDGRAWRPHVTIGRIPPHRRWRRDGRGSVRAHPRSGHGLRQQPSQLDRAHAERPVSLGSPLYRNRFRAAVA